MMPSEVVLIRSVVGSRIANHQGYRFTDYTIDAQQRDTPNLLLQFVTTSDQRAAVCENAKRDRRALRISWEASSFGKKITAIQRHVDMPARMRS